MTFPELRPGHIVISGQRRLRSRPVTSDHLVLMISTRTEFREIAQGGFSFDKKQKTQGIFQSRRIYEMNIVSLDNTELCSEKFLSAVQCDSIGPMIFLLCQELWSGNFCPFISQLSFRTLSILFRRRTDAA